MQQYNSRVAVAVQQQPIDRDKVTILSSFAPNSEGPSAAWEYFSAHGEFPSQESAVPQSLYTHNGEMASAVALKTTLPAKSTRTVHFVVAWWAPEVDGHGGRTDNRTFCGTTDVNRMYHNRYSGADGLQRMLLILWTRRQSRACRQRQWRGTSLSYRARCPCFCNSN